MTKPDILMPYRLLPIAEDELQKRFTVHKLHEAEDREKVLAEVGPKVRGVALGFGPFNQALLDQLPNLEIVAGFGVGYDHIDVPACLAAKVMVTHTGCLE